MNNNFSEKEKVELELLELLEAKEQSIKYRKIDTLFPDFGPYRRALYPKHIEFMFSGAQYAQRAFIAANRVGKTLTGATEFVYHLTGQYPNWWKGKRFLNPVSTWAVGKTTQVTKEVLQQVLLGDLNDIGTGLIPRESIIGSPTRKPGVSDAVETVYIKHVSGGISKCTFRSYDQGREAFQGTYRHVIWLDEEPSDPGIYSECLTRTMNDISRGIIIATFTPLLGLSDTVISFLPDGLYPDNGIVPGGQGKYVVQVTWNDVPHLNNEQKEELLKSYSTHEREARSKGVPSLGSGAIYPYADELIVINSFPIPNYWPKVYGLDVGWNMTAAVWIAQNPDTKELFVYSEHYQGQSVPAIHASAIKARGEWIFGTIDPASLGVSQADGQALYDLYSREGLNLEIAENSVEAGIFEVGQLMASGQLKIFDTCTNLLAERRIYRRDEKGKIIKKKDHALDALRYAVMARNDLLNVEPDPDEYIYKHDNGFSRDPITGY